MARPGLSINLRAIVGNAEHLAILCRTFAALAPCGNVVGVHFLKQINSALVRAVPNRAERTVGLALALGCLLLLNVCDSLYLGVEHALEQSVQSSVVPLWVEPAPQQNPQIFTQPSCPARRPLLRAVIGQFGCALA